MKRVTVASLMLLAFGLSTSAMADYHVKLTSRWDVVQTSADKTKQAMAKMIADKLRQSFSPELEYWLSNDRISQSTSAALGFAKTTIVVTLSPPTYTVVAHDTKRYVTTAAPPDRDSLYTDAVVSLFPTGNLGATGVPNDLRRSINGLACAGYQVAKDGDGGWDNTTVWATEALNLTWPRVEEMLGGIRVAGRFDPLFNRARPQIKGFPLRVEISTGDAKLTIEAIQVEEGPAPAEAFAIPGDFVKTDKLDLADVLDQSNPLGAILMKRAGEKK